MNKSTILGMNRNERRVDITFEKNLNFIDLYFYLMKYLGIDFDSHGYEDKNGEIIKELLLKEDRLDYYKEDFLLEIFFGHKKIILVFESNEELQQKFIEEITSNSNWVKPITPSQ